MSTILKTTKLSATGTAQDLHRASVAISGAGISDLEWP